MFRPTHSRPLRASLGPPNRLELRHVVRASDPSRQGLPQRSRTGSRGWQGSEWAAMLVLGLTPWPTEFPTGQSCEVHRARARSRRFTASKLPLVDTFRTLAVSPPSEVRPRRPESRWESGSPPELSPQSVIDNRTAPQATVIGISRARSGEPFLDPTNIPNGGTWYSNLAQFLAQQYAPDTQDQ
jgi:hypothetical protein